MKTKTDIRTRCECDYCGKKNWSIGAMRRHEKHCTMNPARECRVCKMVDSVQMPTAKLLALIPDVKGTADKYGNVSYSDADRYAVNAAVPALRDACGGCPACMLSAYRQKGIKLAMVEEFSFTESMKQIWSEINSARYDGVAYEGDI